MTNLEKMQSILADGAVDALLLTSQVNRMYAACYDVHEGVAVVGREKCWYFTDSRYIEVAQENLPGFIVEEINRENPYSKRINAALAQLEAKKVGIEEDYLTHGEYLMYAERLQAELVPCQKQISGFRAVKEAWEIERMLHAQEITDKAFADMLKVIRAGMTEKELAAELIYSLYKHGAESLAFAPIVVSGPNTSKPHGVPGDRELQYGDFITMDFGAKVDGYCADMTRTVALGFVSDEMATVYETVLRAQEAAIAMTKAGVTGKEVDGTARQIIADAGYGPYFGHGYGHSLGIEVHESPSPNPSNDQPLPAGVVCSAEPGIYLPGKFGVRIEDVVILEEGGCRNITKSPKNLIVL
jgi:Xaa-Pro aminopeptidase